MMLTILYTLRLETIETLLSKKIFCSLIGPFKSTVGIL